MKILADQFRHNAWANRQVLGRFTGAEPVLDSVCYDGDTLRTRAAHLVGVEAGFLQVIVGDPSVPAHSSDLNAMLARCDQTSIGLIREAEAVDADGLDRQVYVPWWRYEFALSVLFAQVLAHSAQHRAELAWELARAGVSTGELDYIGWEAGGRPEPGHALVFPPGSSG